MSKIKNYKNEFKRQIVSLRKIGKIVASLSDEYCIAKSNINKWVLNCNNKLNYFSGKTKFANTNR